jgi:hypothetical protein
VVVIDEETADAMLELCFGNADLWALKLIVKLITADEIQAQDRTPSPTSEEFT